jgi:prephenate dehydratase
MVFYLNAIRKKTTGSKTNGCVAYQGVPGAFSEIAAKMHFPEAEMANCSSFRDVFRMVETKSAAYGVVPVENTTEGIVNEVYNLLLKSDVKITGEEVVRVRHCLIANRGVAMRDVKEVYSHPQAIAQCREFLRKMDLPSHVADNTAASVKMLKESGIMDAAAIASADAARIYDMEVLQSDIQDVKDNYTRFVMLGHDIQEATGYDKTSIVMTLEHSPGSLVRALELFRKINIIDLEKRPLAEKPFEYAFFIDLDGHISEERIGGPVKRLEEWATSMKVLGSYPKSPDFSKAQIGLE